MKFQHIVSSALLLLSLMSCGPSSYDNVPGQSASLTSDGGLVEGPAIQRGQSGKLAPGDIITLTYPGAHEFNQKQKIRLNNRVSLPMIGDVVAGGKDLKVFQSQLATAYARHLQNPNVVVTLAKTSAAVYISGQVKEPGKVTLDRPMTALEAIMESGGFTKFGSPKRVTVVRNENGKYRRYRLNLEAALGGLAKPFPLKANDVIYVR